MDQQPDEHLPPTKAIQEYNIFKFQQIISQLRLITSIKRIEDNEEHTFPLAEKCFSSSLLVILGDSPVTYKLFPGFSTSGVTLLNHHNQTTST